MPVPFTLVAPALAAAASLFGGAATLGGCARPGPAPAATPAVSVAPGSGPGRAVEDTGPDARLAAAVLEEVNLARADPPGYASLLEEMLPLFEERVLRRPGMPTDLVTVEGAAAVREAIRVLRATSPRKALQSSPGLALAARELVVDQAQSGRTGHLDDAGQGPVERAARHGRWLYRLTENVMYGAITAREVVAGLIVDDGVPDRGHRHNLLDPLVSVAGAACGPHPRYRRMCVIDHATAFIDTAEPPQKRGTGTGSVNGAARSR